LYAGFDLKKDLDLAPLRTGVLPESSGHLVLCTLSCTNFPLSPRLRCDHI